jgi:hypothetical protein
MHTSALKTLLWRSKNSEPRASTPRPNSHRTPKSSAAGFVRPVSIPRMYPSLCSCRRLGRPSDWGLLCAHWPRDALAASPRPWAAPAFSFLGLGWRHLPAGGASARSSYTTLALQERRLWWQRRLSRIWPSGEMEIPSFQLSRPLGTAALANRDGGVHGNGRGSRTEAKVQIARC